MGEDLRPERALLAAMLLAAVDDARHGDGQAQDWIRQVGGPMADEYLGIHPDLWRGDWLSCCSRRWGGYGAQQDRARAYQRRKQRARREAKRHEENPGTGNA